MSMSDEQRVSVNDLALVEIRCSRRFCPPPSASSLDDDGQPALNVRGVHHRMLVVQESNGAPAHDRPLLRKVERCSKWT